VSISAGVAAITSAAQGTRGPWLDNHKVFLCLILIAFIAVANLRGVRESGALFAAPTYSFVISFLFMVGIRHRSLHHSSRHDRRRQRTTEAGRRISSATVDMVPGVRSFLERLRGADRDRSDLKRHSGIQTTRIKERRDHPGMDGRLLAAMFIGTSVMAYLYRVHPSENETVISQFARIIFTGSMGWFYYIIQGTTALILILAANTSFADFPRLASLLARDRVSAPTVRHTR
jgi:amino acid transporter